MANLIVNFKNMCVFAPMADRTEVWYPGNDFHRPFLRIDHLTLEAALHGSITSAGLPLRDRLVEFVVDGQPLPNAKVVFTTPPETLVPFDQLLPSMPTYVPELRAMTERTIAPQLFTKVLLKGGQLQMHPLDTRGGRKLWNMNEAIRTRFCEEVTYTLPIAGAAVVVRLTPRVAGAQPINLPVAATDGNFEIGITSENLEGKTMMNIREPVVFLDEFKLFQPIIRSPQLTAPFTFWSDFNLETDPNGGPCMIALANLT